MPHASDPDRLADSTGRLLMLAGVKLTFSMGIWGGLLFLAAGTAAWPRGWVHLGLWVVTFAINLGVLLGANRAVLAARLNRRRSDEKADRILLAAFLPVTFAIPVVAGLDAVRYQWSSLAVWGIGIGVALHAVGDAVVLWTMVVNPFLERSVRIQADRDHRVITTGPYAFLRHPMYVGVVLLLAGIPLVLGSLWTFAPIGLMVLLLIARTAFEDKLLRSNLPGYEEYARRTRYRLVPGIW